MRTDTMPPHRLAEAPAQVAALFVDMAGVLLDSTPGRVDEHRGHGCGLRAGAGAALRLLERLDLRIIVLAPCARERRRAGNIGHARIADLLFRERVALTGFCACHATGPRCDACPPAPAMLLTAAREYGVALPASWLLASSAQYVKAGQRAGCRTLLVDQDANDGWPAGPECGGNDGPAAYRARDIVDAALAIVTIAEARHPLPG